MKKTFRFVTAVVALALSGQFVSCSKDDDGPSSPDSKKEYQTVTVGFSSVPGNLIGGPTSYGANLYYGDPGQITTGYLAQLNKDTYAQFPINYGDTFDMTDPYGYTFFAGGIAISDFHEMTDGSYLNQLSVYNPLSPSGGNFAVAFGWARDDFYQPVPEWRNNTLADYSACGRIYITDSKGYSAPNHGTAETAVKGEEKHAYFKEVLLCNTTYAYLTMRDGNGYTENSDLESLKGWFKVQFIAFNDNQPNSKPVYCVEKYLANFDPDMENTAGFCGEILKDWTRVDLSSLPETSILVINFVGSDNGDYGLNTPAYCALDNFVIEVEKDLK